jgi:hypothetical protein
LLCAPPFTRGGRRLRMLTWADVGAGHLPSVMQMIIKVYCPISFHAFDHREFPSISSSIWNMLCNAAAYMIKSNHD